ncbi:hypothetical protein KUTeg_007900 [Tegillarca granosa]|uniref:Peptidase M20 dimerisation domain-containing protein n=1 Tax=Tegillarca granosa TaxID=220873 RepID=A0ABQ9FJ88_TEGGR|nr:hypothetical protein KUTeg_007900 [Tegillarca granosa]
MAIQKGNLEGAKIHAENSIRQKNQALNYRRMSARIDAVAARVQTALTTKQVTSSMAGVVKSMESAMKSMNLEKVSQLMDRFETQFENLDVQSQVMENTMCNSSTLTTPQNQVDSLMQEVADEAGLELNMDLPSAQASAIGTPSQQASAEQDELSSRLAKLRQMGITLINKDDKMTDLKKVVCDTVEENKEKLAELSDDLWKNPELKFKEYRSHDVLTSFLESHGFKVKRKYKLETGFSATFNETSDGPNVAVLCEYDALPNIGHACGHNLIAEVGVATGLGIKAALSASDKPLGKLTIIGTPAEEGGCGKQLMINDGAFEGVDYAMMAHPSQFTLSKPKFVACRGVTIKYHGKSSHASSFPWDGLNALDAAVSCYNHVSCLRQQMRPTWRVHGVITKGGEAPNVIPDETELRFMFRTPNEEELEVLQEKMTNCIKAAALGTGCEVEFVFDETYYMSLLSNNTMASLFEDNGNSIGVEFDQRPEIINKFGGSTDMGNVSHVVPSIHPKFFIGTTESNHSKPYTAAAGDPKAQPYTLSVAKALGMTAIDIYIKPDLQEKIKNDFQTDTAQTK